MERAGVGKRVLVFFVVFFVGAVPAAVRGSSPPGRTAISADVVSEDGVVTDVAGNEGQNDYSAEEASEIVELASWGTMTSIFDGLGPKHTAIPANVLGDGDDDDDDDDDDSVCDLLDDPIVRARLSAGLEAALLITCFPGDREKASSRALVCTGSEPGGDIYYENVLVNDPLEDVGQYYRGQSETSMDINPNNSTICVGYNDYGAYTGTAGCDPTCAGFSKGTTLDGGASYSYEDKGQFPAISDSAQTVWKAWADPSLIWSRKDSRFFFSAVVLDEPGPGNSSAIAMWQSTDCDSFSPVEIGGDPVFIHGGPAGDKPLMAVDNTSGNQHYGRIYVAYVDFLDSSCPRCLFSTYSSDSGQSWSTPEPLTNIGEPVQGAWPVVAPNGHVYVAWVHAEPEFEADATISIRVARSTNGGASFNAVTNPMNDQGIAGTDCPASHPCLNGNIKTPSYPQLAVGPSCAPTCELHAVYMYDPDGPGGDASDVFYRRSPDGGVSWKPEALLNDNQDPQNIPTDQWFPTIGVRPDGVVVTSWYDRRRDIDNQTGLTDDNCWFDRFATVSYNGGKNWNGYWPNARLSDRPSQVWTDIDPFYHSDYDQLIRFPGSSEFAYVFWGGAPDDSFAEWDLDVWSQVLPLLDPSEVSEIFWDGFETGDTEVWDSTVGGS